MLIQNLALYEDGYSIRVNRQGDPLFYHFDYDTRSAEVNMQFQHFHTFYELCVTLCPDTQHVLQGKPYSMQMFDIICIPPSVLHMTHYPEGAPCKRLIIRFNLPGRVNGLGDEYAELLSIFYQEMPIFRFAPEIQQQIYQQLNDIFLLAKKKDPMRDLMIHIRFVEFLTLLYQNRAHNLYANETAMTPTEKKMYAVAGYIHAHYAEELSLEVLAQKFYISSCYLSHQFKAVTGFTLTDYIQMTKVRNVQALLGDMKIPITEAAMACGFNSFSQFNRAFRKHIGMSPSQYRQRLRLAAAQGADTMPLLEV